MHRLNYFKITVGKRAWGIRSEGSADQGEGKPPGRAATATGAGLEGENREV